jgi:hypothetical protein
LIALHEFMRLLTHRSAAALRHPKPQFDRVFPQPLHVGAVTKRAGQRRAPASVISITKSGDNRHTR